MGLPWNSTALLEMLVSRPSFTPNVISKGPKSPCWALSPKDCRDKDTRPAHTAPSAGCHHPKAAHIPLLPVKSYLQVEQGKKFENRYF